MIPTPPAIVFKVQAPPDPLAGIETPRFLHCIREVESRDNPHKVGHAGERGAYQFTRDTWDRFSVAPFREAHNPWAANAAAQIFLTAIAHELRINGIPITPYNLARAWNRGEHSRRPHSDYAARVANLYLHP